MRVRQRQVGLRQEPNNGLKLGGGHVVFACTCAVRQRQVGLRQEPNNGLKLGGGGGGVRLCMRVHTCETETGGAKRGAQ